MQPTNRRRYQARPELKLVRSILASSSTCSICEGRRRTFPRDVSTIGSSFEHVFRPVVVWRFRFAVSRSGKLVHLQVRLHRPARLLCGISSGPHSQENVKTLSKHGIMLDDGVHISPDNHAHLPGASSTEWFPDATEKGTLQRGPGHSGSLSPAPLPTDQVHFLVGLRAAGVPQSDIANQCLQNLLQQQEVARRIEETKRHLSDFL
jgi:hypothetical protein